MISLYFPIPGVKKHTSVIPFQSAHDTALSINANRKGITVQEWRRRDDIVKALSESSPFKYGQRFFPPTLEDLEKYGECVIKYIAYTYQALEQDEWPASDNPMVITASPVDADHAHVQFNCTTNYPRKTKPTK